MKKVSFLAVLLVMALSFSGAQTLDEKEIKSVQAEQGSIIFENYNGPVTILNTREQIRGIGTFLASGRGREVQWNNRYKMIRSFQPGIQEGLDGDILVILPDAAVDHIKNLRRILSAYLIKTFAYSKDDADVLARFITYYNAVYYKNWEHFKTRYKEGVLSHLTRDNAGLSTHYSQWPGKSRIIIPLKNGVGGQESSVDTSSISEDRVVEKMRQEPDKELESRRDMVEIREKELDKRQEEADVQQKELEKKREQVEQEEKDLEKKIEEKKEEIKEAEKGSFPEKQAKKELEELEEGKEIILEKKEEIQEEEEALEKEYQDIDREERTIGKMRQHIAEDENTLQTGKMGGRGKDLVTGRDFEEADGAGSRPKGYSFIKVDRSADPAPFGTLLRVTESGEILQKSGLNSIRGTSFSEAARGILVIAGKSEGEGRVRALLLNKMTMEVEKESAQEIYPGSGIWTRGGNVFMVGRSGNDWVLMKYNGQLELQRQSALPVNPDTGLVFINDRILIQEQGGLIKALDLISLEEMKK